MACDEVCLLRKVFKGQPRSFYFLWEVSAECLLNEHFWFAGQDAPKLCLLPFWGTAGFLRRDRSPKLAALFSPTGLGLQVQHDCLTEENIVSLQETFIFFPSGWYNWKSFDLCIFLQWQCVSVLYLGKMKYRKNEQFDHFLLSLQAQDGEIQNAWLV